MRGIPGKEHADALRRHVASLRQAGVGAHYPGKVPWNAPRYGGGLALSATVALYGGVRVVRVRESRPVGKSQQGSQ